MKTKYIFALLGLGTLFTIFFVFDNIFSIWEEASYARFRPVTTGLHSNQIYRDVQVGAVSVDFYTAPLTQGTTIKRPLLVVVHGGFFQGGNKKNYAYLGGLGVRSGYVVAIVQLPRYPGIFTKPFYSNTALKSRSLPAQAKQFAQFLQDVKSLENTYNFDTARVHILTHGSGSLLLGEADVTAFKSVVLVSPLYSLIEHVTDIAPVQLRAIDGYINDAEATRLSPLVWLKKTKEPVLLICAERDLPYIKKACQSADLTRAGSTPIQRVIVKKPSHFELMFHLGSKIEEATDALKKFLFDNAR
ncbi:MAG TPA: hypothetical protein PLY93_07435 [Turneriella sp.]|nr:hypothetical protein [Turneriella sp.]